MPPPVVKSSGWNIFIKAGLYFLVCPSLPQPVIANRSFLSAYVYTDTDRRVGVEGLPPVVVERAGVHPGGRYKALVTIQKFGPVLLPGYRVLQDQSPVFHFLTLF
jgi:hypothetical protein